MRLLWFAPLALCCACRTPAAAVKECPEPLPFSGESFSVSSAVLKENRRINVYLPPSYSSTAAASFPVLYMPDGGMSEDFIHVAEAIHSGISWEILRPVIIVGIENTERRRDLTGPTSVEEDQKIAARVGGSANFRAFIREELMPEIRRRYRVTEESVVAGESLAGLFVLETFFLEPSLFDGYIAMSPSVWWNGGALIRDAGDRLKTMNDVRATLYLTVANEENIVPGLGALAETLKAAAPNGLKWMYHPMPDEFHDTIYRASSPRAFRMIFARQ